MLFGLVQFWLAQNIFGNIGLKPNKNDKNSEEAKDNDKRVPFGTVQLVAIVVMVVLGLLWVINAPATTISNGSFNLFAFLGGDGNNIAILTALGLFLILLLYRFTQYSKITREKLMAVTFFAILSVFFWAIFEQSPGTLTIFANDYTDRSLDLSLIHI